MRNQFKVWVLAGCLLSACDMSTPESPTSEPDDITWRVISVVEGEKALSSFESGPTQNQEAFSAKWSGDSDKPLRIQIEGTPSSGTTRILTLCTISPEGPARDPVSPSIVFVRASVSCDGPMVQSALSFELLQRPSLADIRRSFAFDAMDFVGQRQFGWGVSGSDSCAPNLYVARIGVFLHFATGSPTIISGTLQSEEVFLLCQ